MSRAPWIEHGLGADRLARWHAMGGRYLLSLLIAHAVLITWGYAVTAQTGFLAETTVMWSVVPDVVLATIGLGLLVVVGAISARTVRRRVSYETWYLIHLLTYIAVALSFLHVLTAGADFQTGWAKAAWIALYAAVGVALLWYRWLVPVRDALRHRLRVASVTTEAPGVVSITVAGEGLDRLGVQPGQFFRWRFLTPSRLVAVPPVLPVRDSDRHRAADHRQGPRRPQPRPSASASRHQGDRRRTLRRLHPGPPTRPRRAPAGRRDRDHPAAHHARTPRIWHQH